MFYAIRHLTRFRYKSPVSESIMELRMRPRTEGPQRCLSFQLSVDPRTRLHEYRDYLGNTINHFNVPAKHTQLRIVAESLVEVQPPLELPASLGAESWHELDAFVAAGDYAEMLMPSHYVRSPAPLVWLAEELGVVRRGDPLSLLMELNEAIYGWFEYVPKSTRVDSPIDEAIANRRGVCQDFAHIMSALARHIHIPCRYVSGYLYHPKEGKTRSVDGATHAWVEALLPEFGWVGFDPTNNLVAGERHIRTAIGRDYADVPPTKGVFKGGAESELSVAVKVSPSDAPPPPDVELSVSQDWTAIAESDAADQQQQQQQ